MNEHPTQWLQAYHDGELHGRKLRELEAHLTTCVACQAELESLRSLSLLLQENLPAPSADDLLAPDLFAAQVQLQLPQQQEKSSNGKSVSTLWFLFPVILLLIWGVLQATSLVSTAALLAVNLGFGGDAIAEVLLGLETFAQTQQDVAASAGVTFLDYLTPTRFVMPLAVSLLYVCWLAIWWVRRTDTVSQSAPNN